jgi:hypothetical protein
MADTPIPPLADVLAQIDADIEDDNSPEQKALEATLAALDQEIADDDD